MIITIFNGVFYTFLSAFQNKQSILYFALVPMFPTRTLSVSSDTDSMQAANIGKTV